MDKGKAKGQDRLSIAASYASSSPSAYSTACFERHRLPLGKGSGERLLAERASSGSECGIGIGSVSGIKEGGIQLQCRARTDQANASDGISPIYLQPTPEPEAVGQEARRMPRATQR